MSDTETEQIGHVTEASIRVVPTDSGPITLLDLPRLKATLGDLKAKSAQKLEEAQSLRSLAEERFAERGTWLLENATESGPDDESGRLLDQARLLKAHIAEDEATLTRIRGEDRHGVQGIVARVGDWNETRHVSSDRASLHGQLQPILVQLGRHLPHLPTAVAMSLLEQAKAAEAQAAALESEGNKQATAAGIVEDEIHRREEAERELGFDAPYLVAQLKTSGPPSLESPLNLKRGEQAMAVLPAALARNQTHTQWVGGSQGFSFPIGHTGIRYRVGSYHGHPIQRQVLSTIDSGSLVITNQRVAFIGRAKSTSVAISKLIHVQCYSDALAVFQEGRENPDFFLLDKPKYALFMINWAASQA